MCAPPAGAAACASASVSISTRTRTSVCTDRLLGVLYGRCRLVRGLLEGLGARTRPCATRCERRDAHALQCDLQPAAGLEAPPEVLADTSDPPVHQILVGEALLQVELVAVRERHLPPNKGARVPSVDVRAAQPPAAADVEVKVVQHLREWHLGEDELHLLAVPVDEVANLVDQRRRHPPIVVEGGERRVVLVAGAPQRIDERKGAEGVGCLVERPPLPVNYAVLE